VNATINERNRAMVDKNIRFSMNLLRLLKNRLCVSNVKNADTCFKKTVYALGKLLSLEGGENTV